jgi:hypothetical protein
MQQVTKVQQTCSESILFCKIENVQMAGKTAVYAVKMITSLFFPTAKPKLRPPAPENKCFVGRRGR